MTESKKICSIVVPVFGNGDCLNELVDRVDSSFSSAGLEHPEIIFVDDLGPGNAWEKICHLRSKRRNVIGVQLMRNTGQHNAVMCGLRHAHGDIIITMDDDLQHEPESIPQLIECLRRTNSDLVYGVYDSKKHAGTRNFGSWVVTRFYRIVSRMPITITSFRAVRRELVAAILHYDLNFTFIDGLLAWNTQRIETIPVAHHPRAQGKSGYTLRALLALALNIFTNFSLIPLQVVSLLGITTAVTGLGLGSWYLIAAMRSAIEVPGYASTIVAILVLGGIQMLSLGVIGEYVGRLHLNVNRKPQYTVRQTISSSGIAQSTN